MGGLEYSDYSSDTAADNSIVAVVVDYCNSLLEKAVYIANRASNCFREKLAVEFACFRVVWNSSNSKIEQGPQMMEMPGGIAGIHYRTAAVEDTLVLAAVADWDCIDCNSAGSSSRNWGHTLAKFGLCLSRKAERHF